MTGLRPHTKLYSQERRNTLGIAVARAREKAGYSRPAFVRVSGVGKTSLYKLETGKPVGAPVYEGAARALPGWSEDTPRSILEGGPVPEAVARPESRESGGPVVPDFSRWPTTGYRPGSKEWWRHYWDILPEDEFYELREFTQSRRAAAEREDSDKP